jgi:hypothetical protein
VDAKNDKEVFQQYLQVKASSDVDSIHTFTDFLGIDYKVLIAFKCDSSAISRIVEKNGLAASEVEHDSGLLFSDELSWWNKQVINKIRPYKKDEPNGDKAYLWYDKLTGNAYYEQFSI